MPDWTIDELMCACIARQVRDGDLWAQGLATPLVAAGYLLALRTHAPNLYFASAIGQSLCREAAPIGLARTEALWLDLALTHIGFVQAAADVLPALRPKEFFRPGQIDASGNTNNLALGSNPARPRVRLPGAAGFPDVSALPCELYFYVPRHSRVTFVERVDFVTGVGHHPGRAEGTGPRYLVSDLAQFDFAGGRLRLTHLHPAARLEEVQARTGFALEIPPALATTEPPTNEEIRLLREEIDPLGVRRLEFLRGPERRRALAAALRREQSL
jgi:glutaconate CoA-transferase subunit B